MTTPESNDWLEELLRQPPQEIKDNGFTARTLANLPRRRRMPLWVRPAVQCGLPVLLAAAVLAFYIGPHAPAMGADLLTWVRVLDVLPVSVLIAVCSLFAVSFTEAVSTA